MKITAYIKVPNGKTHTILGDVPAFNIIEQLEDDQIEIIRDTGKIRFIAEKRMNYQDRNYVPKGALVTIYCDAPSFLPQPSSAVSTDSKVVEPDPVKEKNDS